MLSGIGPRADARGARHSGARRSARRRPEPAGPLRSRRRQPHEVRRVGVARRARRSPATTRSTGSGRARRSGVYTTNGAVLSVIARSSPAARCPTCSATRCSADFSGYFPGYSTLVAKQPQLPHLGGAEGAHQQHAPARSRCARPIRATRRSINFHYFEEGSDAPGRGPRVGGRRHQASCAS